MLTVLHSTNISILQKTKKAELSQQNHDDLTSEPGPDPVSEKELPMQSQMKLE